MLPLCRPVEGASDVLDALMAKGLRVLAVAGGAWSGGAPSSPTDVEADLELYGLIGLQDPPRLEVRDAIGSCRTAGIKVGMVTGDHPETARAIAEEVGLWRHGAPVLVGADLPADEKVLGALLDNDGIVVARVSPEQKLSIARALHARGHVVAMTGDGVNDGPALHEADIGIAMGRSGTDVAREAADLVLLDDDFSTIVTGIEMGQRRVPQRPAVPHLPPDRQRGGARPVRGLGALGRAGSPSPSGSCRSLPSTSAPTRCRPSPWAPSPPRPTRCSSHLCRGGSSTVASSGVPSGCWGRPRRSSRWRPSSRRSGSAAGDRVTRSPKAPPSGPHQARRSWPWWPRSVRTPSPAAARRGGRVGCGTVRTGSSCRRCSSDSGSRCSPLLLGPIARQLGQAPPPAAAWLIIGLAPVALIAVDALEKWWTRRHAMGGRGHRRRRPLTRYRAEGPATRHTDGPAGVTHTCA